MLTGQRTFDKKCKKAQLIEGPVIKSLFNMTLPIIVGMVVFNLVDTFFVGKLGAQELAALSFTFPVVVVSGLAMGIGTGASAVVSQAIGRGDHYRVKRLTTDSLIVSMLLVTFFVIFGLYILLAYAGSYLFGLTGIFFAIVLHIR